jgi:hypothetical protein
MMAVSPQRVYHATLPGRLLTLGAMCRFDEPRFGGRVVLR